MAGLSAVLQRQIARLWAGCGLAKIAVMQSALIIGLTFLATFAKIATVLRIVVSRLASRYPLFTIMVAFSAMRSVVLLAVGGWAARLHPYLEIWNATLGISYALEAAACFEGFWILVLHFRNVKVFGSIAFLFFSVIGTTLSYSIVAIWSGRWKTPLTQTAVLGL